MALFGSYYIKKGHYSNFCTFEISNLVNVPGHYLRKCGICMYWENTSLTKMRQKKDYYLRSYTPWRTPLLSEASLSYLFKQFYNLRMTFKQHFLAEKRQKNKDLLLALHDEPPCCQNRSSLAKPNGTDLGTNIRHSLCNSPPPLLLCSCSRDRSFRIDLLFCYVCGVTHVPGGKFIENPEILQHFYVF